MVLLAALDVVLGRLAGQEDVVVGTPIAGRTRAETERMVGLFLNSLALRTDLSGDPSSASCWGGCARPRWTRTRTRSSPSSGCWRRCVPSGAWRTRPCSR